MESQSYEGLVSAVIVTYNPDLDSLLCLLKAASSQVSTLIVVDNGSSAEVTDTIQYLLPSNGTLIQKGFNSGIAEAFNTGIAEANKLGSSHVILFDQDSEPAPDMVDVLMQSIQSSDNVAAVGPQYSDVKSTDQELSGFVRLKRFSFEKVDCHHGDVVEVDHLISSGCLISMKALKDIGGMEEALFIDYVDTEWCLRAIDKGYSLLGVGSALMKHDLGDDFIRLFGRNIPMHSPLRHYYLIRNGIWLLRQPWVSSQWRIMDVRRLILMYIAFSTCGKSRFRHWQMMSVGIWHGLIGRAGAK